jgi:aminoglycoside phosphotransferase family enzyme/predicted kinase
MATTSQLEEIVAWLSRPESYPHQPMRVEVVQTHISYVFLAGPFVYKLKKPVRYDFLDFSTPQAREHACREELRLNRRLAPQTYIDVVPVTRQKGKLRLGGDGPAIDWLVHMHRLPTEQTLEALHRRGSLRLEHIAALAGLLCNFYDRLPPLPLSAQQYRERYAAHVRGNLRELAAVSHHLPLHTVERIHGFQLQLLLLRPHLFDERVAQGRIVDGHGDLRPEHICLTDPPVIFDCIEFSSDLRTIDVADELAFLTAECDFLGATWVGPRLVAAWQDHSGDRPLQELVDFYKSYRACVRAKVAALRADQAQGAERDSAAASARQHLDLADRYAAPWIRPLVLAVGGLSGTGKTTLAVALAEALGADLLRTDVVRQELFGQEQYAAETDSGIYRPEWRQRVYDAMFERGARLNGQRVSVVLDGTFSTVESVRGARGVAAAGASRFLAIECVCRPEVAQERIRRRREQGRDASEARPELYEIQRQRWQPWPADVPQVRVDTELPLATQVEQVIATLAQAAREF